MSLFKSIFGKKKRDKSPSLPQAIRNIKSTEEDLLLKQSQLETRIDAEIANARRNATNNKKAAIEALRRKKRLEKRLKQIDGALTTIEIQRDNLERANVNQVVVNSMKNGANALKSTNKTMNVEEVDALLDDFAEQAEDIDEIAGALSVGFKSEEFDEDELERELQELTIHDVKEKTIVEPVPHQETPKKARAEAIMVPG